MSDDLSNSPPLSVEHRRADARPNRFLPDARLVVTPAFRTSGLLSLLSDADARTLLAVVTFLAADGRFTGTIPAIAAGLGVTERDALARLASLTALSFEGAPVAVEVPREQAQAFYVPGPRVLRHVQEEQEAAPEARPAHGSAFPQNRRASVIAASRARYARPRAEVERLVAEQLGHSPLESEDSPEGDALRRMLSVGVTREDALRLLGSFPLARITRQLDWLPHREARLPARYLIAAIEGDYDPPAHLRAQAAAAEAAEAQMAVEPSNQPPGPNGPDLSLPPDLAPAEPAD